MSWDRARLGLFTEDDQHAGRHVISSVLERAVVRLGHREEPREPYRDAAGARSRQHLAQLAGEPFIPPELAARVGPRRRHMVEVSA